MIGISGAHRTGKTTLARSLSERLGLNFVASPVGALLEEVGVHPKHECHIEKRLYAQEHLLRRMRDLWFDNLGSGTVFDRTPMDLLSYMESDILRAFPNTGDLAERYLAYRKDCLDCAELFDKLVVVQPGIQPSEAPTSAEYSLPYMEHLNSLLLGYTLQMSMPKVLVLPREMLDSETRTNYVIHTLHETNSEPSYDQS